jgi:hypothetical protein
MAFTTLCERWHYEFFVILAVTPVATDYLFPFGWRSVLALPPLRHNTGVFRRMTGNTLLIGKFTDYGTARVKIFRIKIIRRVIPSDHGQKPVELP